MKTTPRSFFLFLFFSLFFFSFPAFSQTDVSGNISTNTTWNLSGSPYRIISDDVVVLPGATLTINPGVEVHFDDFDFYLRIQGKLQANGTANNRIRFYGTNSQAAPYYGGLVVDGGEAKLSYVDFERTGPLAINNSDLPLYAQVAALSGTLSIDHSTFSETTFGAAISLGPGVDFTGNNNDFQNIETGQSAYVVTSDVAMSMEISNNTYAGLSGVILVSGLIEDGGGLVWDKKEIPYCAYFPQFSNTNLTILPGVEVKFYEGGSLWMYDGNLNAKGTSDEPILFNGGFPEENSFGGGVVMLTNSDPGINHYFEYCIFQKMDNAIIGSQYNYNNFQDSLFSVKSSKFENISENAIGLSLVNPIIQSNCFSNIGDTAVYSINYDFSGIVVNADNNYWDHPSGAYNAINYPNGQGVTVGRFVRADFPLQNCSLAEFIDLAVGDLISPDVTCETGNDFAITVEIDNLSSSPQSNFQLQLKINNGLPFVENPNLTIPAQGSVNYTFTPTVDINYFETNELQVTLIFPDDQNINNNTRTFIVESIPFDGQTVDSVKVCENQPNVYLSASGGYSYLWSTGSTNYYTYLDPLQSGDYYVTISNFLGCTDVDTINVLAYPVPTVPVFFASSNTLCPGGTVTLTVQNVSENLLWNTGETGTSITISQPGYYAVTHVGDNGCSSTSQLVAIGQESTPYLYTSGDGIICGQEEETIYVSGPFGSSYEWSTGENTASIAVMPAVSTQYTVTVTTPNNCVHVLERTITVASDAPPGMVSNLLPLDGAQNIALPMTFSWSPGANATHYDVYIWIEGTAEPTFPSFSTIQLSQSFSSGLLYGETYNWKVCTRNICGTANEVCTGVQSFTLNYLPDLQVLLDTDSYPDTAFSGTEIEVNWQTRNNGVGSTQGISTNGFWYDACYLSTDMNWSSDDLSLGWKINPNALVSGAGYNSTLVAQLPQGITGSFYLIVCADRYGNMPESNEQNNCQVATTPIFIQLSPYPDLVVDAFPPPSGAAGGVVFAGENYDLQWTVKNRNNGLNATATKSGEWYDRIYISSSNVFNGQTARTLKNIRHQGNLATGESYTATANIQIPATAEDTIYLFVCTDIYNAEYEYVFENNNCLVSQALRVPVVPKPDLVLEAMTAPDTASNRENITISWEGKNIAAAFDGFFYDRIYLSERRDLLGTYYALGSTNQTISLPNNAVYTSEDDFQIPSNITGKYYLIIQANAFNNVAENDYTNNLIVDSIFIISPNLSVTNIATLPDAFSGQTITVNWTIANPGIGDLLSTTVSDRVRLIDVSDPTKITQLGVLSNNLTIFSGNTLTRQLNYTIPNGFTGDFCIEVETNYNRNTYENGQYSDNVLLNCDTFHIYAADYPNLVASTIESAATNATAGESIEVTFKTVNNGLVATSGSWGDRIYLSTNSVWNPNDAILLKSIAQSQVIFSGGFYEKTVAVQLPTYLAAGNYYLYLQTDYNNSVFETAEDDNIVASTHVIAIAVYPKVDLQFVGTPVGPATLTPGESAMLSYEVKNDGTVITPTDNWVDALYLSPNPTWEPSDILIKQWPRTTALDAGASYARQESFTLPQGFTDAFYLCLVIDHENAVTETNENNNYLKILQQNGDTINIIYPPKPDLTVAEFNSSDNGQAGQPLKVYYTIQNLPLNGAASGAWSESIFLSTDQNLNGGDLLLGQKNYSQGLAAGAQYQDSLEVTLPLNISGNYFILLKTDGGNILNEALENNNVASHYVFITQPSAGDLVVLAESILPPPLDTIATETTISWSTKNIGQNPVSGYMEEGVYLSTDTLWDAADLLLGVWQGNVALDPNAVVKHQLTARLQNVRRQDYYVVVKTDLRDHFLESEEANNCTLGLNTLFVEIPELPIGLPGVATSMALEKPIYYRIEIPTDTIGETMRVSLKSTDTGAFNELYLRRNDIPSRSVHDFAFGTPFVENQEIIVPSLQAGTYYVLAYAVDGMALQNVDLLAEIIPFQITAIHAEKGGNTGAVTVLLEGAKFASGMTVQLEKTGLPIIVASRVEVVNSTRAFVTFPLGGVAIGTYDVVAMVPTAQDRLTDGFKVVTGTIGNRPTQVNCTFSIGDEEIEVTNVPDDLDVVFFEPSHPSFVRPNQTVPITLRFENIGDVDIPVPSRIFSSINGFPLAEATDGLDDNLQDLPLTFTEENGPSNVLRPGAVAFITVYSKATKSEGVLKFKLLSN